MSDRPLQDPSAPTTGFSAGDPFRLLVESVADYVICLLDPAGRVSSWNTGAERIKGYPAEEILGSPYSRFFSPEAIAAGLPTQLLSRALQEGRCEEEGIQLRKDGTPFWARITLTALFDESGAHLGYATVTRDVTEQRAIAEETHRQARLLDQAFDPILTWDREGRITYWNGGAERLYGYSATEALGQVVHDLLGTEFPESREACLTTLFLDGAWEGELRQRTRRDRWVIVESRMEVRRTGSDEPQVLQCDRNITRRKQVEARLRESEERHRRFLEMVPDGIFVNQDDRIVFCNPAFVRMSGRKDASEILGRSPFEFTAPEFHEIARQRIRFMLEHDEPAGNVEQEMLRPDGTRVPIEVRAAPIRLSGSRAILAVVHDLTARREVEDRFRLVVEGIKDYAIYVLDPQSRVVSWNAGAERILGYPLPEALGRPYASFFTREDAAEDRPGEQLRIAAVEGRAEAEGWRVRKDGSRFWCNGVVTALFDRDGSIRGYGVVARDLTHRHQTEALLRSVVDCAIDGILTIDAEGTIQSFNQSACRIFGYDQAEVVGQNVRVLMPEPYHSNHQQYLENYLRTGEAKIIGIGREVEGRRKDGSIFPLRLAVSEFELDGRRMFTGIVEDLSERKRLEEQLRQSQKMEAVGQLAGGVAHDFNNLLTIIGGYGEMLLDTLPPTHTARGMVSGIMEAGDRAGKLTRQLLAFSRKQVLKPQVTDLNEIVGSTEQMLARLIGENIQLSSARQPDLWPVLVDPGQMEQVLMNLAINARDAMPKGGALTIETRNLELDEDYHRQHPNIAPGRWVLLSVTDTGVGIPAEIRDHVFEPFFTTKGPSQGTGLGLATVFGIVRQSGGDISLYSEVGIGTCFKILLPAALDGSTAAPTETPVPPQRGGETILLVEDETEVRKIARLALETRGYHVLEAPDGQRALEVAAAHDGPIHLLVSDVVMPGMSGRELGDLLLQQRPETRILFMSGYAEEAVHRHGNIGQADAFLPKPFTPLSLARAVRAVLDAPSST